MGGKTSGNELVKKQISSSDSEKKIKWDDEPDEIIVIKTYGWDSSNNNGTCTLYVTLPSEIKSTGQVNCVFPDSTTLYLRARTSLDTKTEYRLVLSPLRHEIAISDSVCKFN